MDNPQVTLVQESRTLTLQQGVNHVDFSWTGVQINQDSIRLDILSQKDNVSLLSVSYPPQESALVWAIHSTIPAQVKVRISYLLSRLDSLSTYRGVVNLEETAFEMASYRVVRNFSGEDFGAAEVSFGSKRMNVAPIRHGETKRLLAQKIQSTPLTKRIVFDSKKHPWDPEKEEATVGLPVSYISKNIKENGLGSQLLSRGKMRVFIEDGHGSVVFVGEDHIGPVPIGQNMDVTIGRSRDVKVTQRKMSSKKVNVRRNSDNHVVLYDLEELVKAELKSFKDKPVLLIVKEHIPGEWEMLNTNVDYTRKDAHTVEYEIGLPPSGSMELVMQYRRRNIRR